MNSNHFYLETENSVFFGKGFTLRFKFYQEREKLSGSTWVGGGGAALNILP